VDDVSFELIPGEVFALLGPNGAGKTTTLRMLAGIIAPTSGEVRVGNEVLSSGTAPHLRRRIGFLTEAPGLWDRLTVSHNLLVYARLYDLPNPARSVDEALDLFDLRSRRDDRAAVLSKGLKQRVALGRAIIHDPQLLVLDEPAANLDPRARIEFRTLIRELASDGKTVLLSSHILTELSEICDAVAVIEKGKILATGTVEEIMTGLRAHRVLSVRLAGSQESAMRFLLEQPDVARVVDANDRLQLEFTGDDASQVALLGRLVAAGFPILEFNSESAGLEDLFMKITAGNVQ